MRILVLGASGQIGHALVRIGNERGHSMVGTYRSHELPGLIQLDLLDFDATRAVIRDARPDWVIDCACWPWVDGNENDPDKAQKENVDTVAVGAAAVAEAGANWCYLSTSYVFDGKQRTPHTETDPVAPVSVYGRTKARAEEISRVHFGEEALIIRTIVVWGPDPQRKNFAHQLVESALEKKRIRVPSDQLGNPTYGPDLAGAILRLIGRSAGGTWNVAGPEAELDRVAFARLLCEKLGLDGRVIEPATTAELGQVARRPLNGALATDKLDEAGLSLRGTAEALEDWRIGEWDWPWQDL
jgi:dTDP-4-dehydrorhamnose reductase